MHYNIQLLKLTHFIKLIIIIKVRFKMDNIKIKKKYNEYGLDNKQKKRQHDV